MPEDTLGTGGAPDPGSQDGSPAGGAPVASGSEEMVPVSRLNGLMSTLNKEQLARQKAEQELERYRAAQAPVAPAAPVQPDLTEVIRSVVEPVTAESRAVFNMLKEETTRRLLTEYPYADPSDIRGSNPEEWTASAKAAHERIQALVDQKAEAAKAEAEEEARRQFGLPPGVGPGGGGQPAPADPRELYEKAKEAGDPVAAAAALLLTNPNE